MYRVEDLAYLLDMRKVDLVTGLKEKELIRPEVTSQAQFNEQEEAIFAATYTRYLNHAYGCRKKWRAALYQNLFFKTPEVVNLARVCNKAPKFMAKDITLRPSFPERYESATETEEDEAEQPECNIAAFDSDIDEEECTHMSEFLKSGRTMITESNFREMGEKSMR